MKSIATGANAKYFGALLNLIGSIHRHCMDVNEIRVYDIGLTKVQRDFLHTLFRVIVHPVPTPYPHFKDVESFAWKVWAVSDALPKSDLFLWLDAGTEVLRPLADLWATIEKDGYLFNVTPFFDKNATVGGLTHETALKKMGVGGQEGDGFMINSGIMGYRNTITTRAFVNTALAYAFDPEIICGPKDNPRRGHRHDQSIYSVLRIRLKMKARYWLFRKDDFALLIRAGHEYFESVLNLNQSVITGASVPYVQVVHNRNAYQAMNMAWLESSPLDPIDPHVVLKLKWADPWTYRHLYRRLREWIGGLI